MNSAPAFIYPDLGNCAQQCNSCNGWSSWLRTQTDKRLSSQIAPSGPTHDLAVARETYRGAGAPDGQSPFMVQSLCGRVLPVKGSRIPARYNVGLPHKSVNGIRTLSRLSDAVSKPLFTAFFPSEFDIEDQSTRNDQGKVVLRLSQSWIHTPFRA